MTHRKRWCLRCTCLESVLVHCGTHFLLTAEAWWDREGGAFPRSSSPCLPTVVSPRKVVEEYVLKLNAWSASGGLGRSIVNPTKSLTGCGWTGSWLGASPAAEPEASIQYGGDFIRGCSHETSGRRTPTKSASQLDSQGIPRCFWTDLQKESQVQTTRRKVQRCWGGSSAVGVVWRAGI